MLLNLLKERSYEIIDRKDFGEQIANNSRLREFEFPKFPGRYTS